MAQYIAVKEKPSTLEEYFIRELEQTKAELKLTQKANEELKAENIIQKSVIELVKQYAEFDGNSLTVYIGVLNEQDLDFLADELKLRKENKEKSEEKENE